MTSTTQLHSLRYDSPAATLEVTVRDAAVSHWSDRPVVQVLRYSLQLRNLNEADELVEIRGDRTSFVLLAAAVQEYIHDQLTETAGRRDRPFNAPRFESNGLTQHTLYLGSLRTADGRPTVTLSALQLADLGDVFEQLETQVRVLPVSITSVKRRRPWQQWGAVAAGMVAAVGLTTVLWPNYQSQQSGDTILEAPSATPEATRESAELDPGEARSPRSTNRSEPTTADANGPSSAESPLTQRHDAPPPAGRNIPDSTGVPDDRAPLPDESPTMEGAPPPSPPMTAAPAPPAASTAPQSGRASGDRAVAPQSPPPTAAAELAPAAPSTADNQVAADAAPESFSDPEDAMPRRTVTAEPDALMELVEQVRDRWEPPADLEQALTYTLVFAADGTLAEVVARDALAEQYRESSGIPAVGTEWLPSGDPRRVDLLLMPDGSVTLQDSAP